MGDLAIGRRFAIDKTKSLHGVQGINFIWQGM